MIKLKRAHEKPSRKDSERVLVERLWPRGMTKQAVRVDPWLKETAPSADLRNRFARDTEKWTAFCERYRSELKDKTKLIHLLKRKAKAMTVTPTPMCSTRDHPAHNCAPVLKEFIKNTKP